jgi:Centriolar protein SAS N-terminal
MSAICDDVNIGNNTTDATSILYSSIEELDPSLQNGHRLLYDREVPLEIRHHSVIDNDSKSGTFESIKVKILITGSEDAPSSIRVELSSEADLFFHFMHEIEEAGYRRIQVSQKLMVSFADYPKVLIRMLNSCIREPHVHIGVFTTLEEHDANGNNARLDFVQNMEYKYVELMSCGFHSSPDELVQSHITYRYNSLKQKLNIMQTRLYEINAIVKSKNPSLLLQLQKNPSLTTSSASAGASAGVGSLQIVSDRNISARF